MLRIFKFESIEIFKKLIYNFSITSRYLRRRILKLLIISTFSAVIESITLLTLYLLTASYTSSNVNDNLIGGSILKFFAEDRTILGIIVIISLIIVTFLKVYVNKLQNVIGSLMGSEIAKKYMSNVMEAGIKNTTKENYDEVISVLSTDIPYVTTVYQTLFGVVLAILSAASIIMTLYTISGTKSIIALFGISIFYISSFKSINKVLLKDGKKFALLNQKAISLSRSILDNLRIILIDNKKVLFENYFSHSFKKSKLIRASISTKYSTPKFVIEGIVYILIISIVILVESNFLSFINLSELIGITFGILRLVSPAQISFNFFSNLIAVSSQLDRINSKLFIKFEKSKSDKKESINFDKINFDSKNIKYSLKGISHKFNNSSKLIINNINLDFFGGQKICIVGKSGSGKSTLADILSGLLLPSSGKIGINGVNLSGHNGDRNEWKKRISYIPQNFTMISDDIRENIIFDFDEKNLDRERFNNCLKVSKIENLLDLKINKDVNTIANKLSGGQKQRINIARGIYKKADIYIFDEITSSLDVITKKDVINSIFDYLNSKTIFFITHDLSYLDLFDKVIFLEKGKIEIEGKFDYALKNSDKFCNFVKENQMFR